MNTEHRPISPSPDELRAPTGEWRPGDDFDPRPVGEVFGGRAPDEFEDPLGGSGLGWDLPAAGGSRRLEIFPARENAVVHFVDAQGKPRRRGYVVHHLATDTASGHSHVVITARNEGVTHVLRVYPTGEFDEHVRVDPAWTETVPDGGLGAHIDSVAEAVDRGWMGAKRQLEDVERDQTAGSSPFGPLIAVAPRSVDLSSASSGEVREPHPSAEGPDQAERWADREGAARRLARQGIVFQRVPTELRPGMPYTTAEDLAESDRVAYTARSITRMARDDHAIGAVRFEGLTLIPPEGVERLLERQERRLLKQGRGRPLGSRSTRPRRGRPRRDVAADPIVDR